MVVLAATTVSAQELMQRSKVFDNVSIGVLGGVTTPTTHSKFWKGMRGAAGLELNKQLTPVIGVTAEGIAYFNTTKSKTAVDASNVSGLLRINLNNLFAGYAGAPRVFEVEAVGGAGWAHTYGKGYKDNWMTSKVGLNFNFNCCESKALTFSLRPALVYGLGGNGTPLRYDIDRSRFELLGGLTYHFKNSNGKRHFAFGKAYDQAEVDGLNAKINKLRGKVEEANAAVNAANRNVAQLQEELAACRNKKPEVKTVTEKTNMLESVVTFRQGRSTIDASQLPNVERIASYLNKYPEASVVIKGYASPEGSQEVNARIAKQRAEAVKALLMKRYKISASRIDADGQGVGDMFSEPDWNRVSICTIKSAKK